MSGAKKRRRSYQPKGHQRCSHCGRRGHNARRCPERIAADRVSQALTIFADELETKSDGDGPVSAALKEVAAGARAAAKKVKP